MVDTKRSRNVRRTVSNVGRTSRASGCPAGKRGSTRSVLVSASNFIARSPVGSAKRGQLVVRHDREELLCEALRVFLAEFVGALVARRTDDDTGVIRFVEAITDFGIAERREVGMLRP